MTIKDAVAAPRIHMYQNQIQLENTVPKNSAVGLRNMGYQVKMKRPPTPGDTGMYFGGVHAAMIRPDNLLQGAPDPRRDGVALGL